MLLCLALLRADWPITSHITVMRHRQKQPEEERFVLAQGLRRHCPLWGVGHGSWKRSVHDSRSSWWCLLLVPVRKQRWGQKGKSLKIHPSGLYPLKPSIPKVPSRPKQGTHNNHSNTEGGWLAFLDGHRGWYQRSSLASVNAINHRKNLTY